MSVKIYLRIYINQFLTVIKTVSRTAAVATVISAAPAKLLQSGSPEEPSQHL